MLSDLGASSLYIGLLQKTVVWAAGTPAVHELAVVKGQTELVTEMAGEAEDTSVPSKRFKGTLQLNKAPATSFKSHNLEVNVRPSYVPYKSRSSKLTPAHAKYVILLNLVNPSSGVAQDTLLQVPVNIVSIPPVSRYAAEVQQTNEATRRASLARRRDGQPPRPVVIPQEMAEADMPELPPNYFDVVESDRRQ